MTLWLLKPVEDWDPWYDKVFGFVIRAETEQEARELAMQHGGDERKHLIRGGDGYITIPDDVWLKPELVMCMPISVEGPFEIILRDMRSA